MSDRVTGSFGHPIHPMGPMGPMGLLDYRRRVSDIYYTARSSPDPAAGWRHWREARDGLFQHHPHSPVPAGARASWGPIPYYDYDPSFRVLGTVREVPKSRLRIHTSGDDGYDFIRFAEVSFDLHGEALALGMYWLDSYAGGLFISFRDATSGSETYGACRYLFDSAKGADLGMQDGSLILDFNFAYNPSCAYDPRWVCPLAPPDNHLTVAVTAGERMRG